MKIRGMWRVQQAERWLKYRTTSHALILVYHRIIDLPDDPYMLAVKPNHFAEQMEVIRSYCHPVSLKQLAGELQKKKITNRAIIVTFDDGYADNLDQAKPILERYEIPATVFVTAGHIGSHAEFWWDELDRLVLQTGKMPGRLRLIIAGSEFTWESKEHSSEVFHPAPGWNIEREDDPHPRYQLFRQLYERIHPLSYPERQKVLGEIRTWTGAKPSGRDTHRSMTGEEVVSLEKGGLFEVGAHTMHHSDLSVLPPTEQHAEIMQSKENLEKILNHAVQTFAYPYGSGSRETINILEEYGFECACATHADAVWPNADRFQLPRLGVRDLNRQEFDQFLNWWMNG